MGWKHWTVLGAFAVGFVWTPAWLIGLVLLEIGIRHGRDVAALWAVGHIGRFGNRD